ncbi:MAG TPA: cell division protein [Caulobacteraceae bacterium]|nr:cell division protein [Caulobacteraceae bacterium]
MNPIARLFDQRVRGFRIIEVAALACLVLMVFWVYLAKAGAGRERAEITRIERDIATEQKALRLLRAEAAHLEQPARIEALAEQQLGLEPVPVKREARPESLIEIARATGGGPR